VWIGFIESVYSVRIHQRSEVNATSQQMQKGNSFCDGRTWAFSILQNPHYHDLNHGRRNRASHPMQAQFLTYEVHTHSYPTLTVLTLALALGCIFCSCICIASIGISQTIQVPFGLRTPPLLPYERRFRAFSGEPMENSDLGI